ncbi:MAG: acyltransferase domain-containing protein, partial [Anaerolineales bacterium]|nr:acyltransferase domain-containing protein [Anaerolineales bacterium]
LFTVEYALAQLLLSWDIQPQAMIGHSIGEYVAACLAGVFSLEDALAIVSVRGGLMQKMAPGSMLAVPLTETAVQPYLSADIDLATINAPNRCVLAGPTDAINALAARLEADGVTARPLHTSHAFHSHMMEPMLDTFSQRLQHIEFHPPQVPIISNVTGEWMTAEQAADPLYWAQHVRHAVRFADGIQLLAQQPETILLEVGPGTTLRTLAQRHPGRPAAQPVMATMRHPKEEQADDYTLLKTVGQLWLNGVSFRWDGFYENEFRHRVLLPTYPFERQRYWIEPGADADVMPTALFKQPDMKDWFYLPSWKRTMPPVLERPLTPQTWLIFHNDDALSAAVLDQLKQLDVTAVSVSAGDTFQNENNQFTIRPAAAEDYEMVWQTLYEQEILPTHVLHMWNVTSELTTDALDRSFYSLLYTAQAIAKTDAESNVELGVVTSHLQQIGAEIQPSHPEKATVLGACKIIPQEMANIHCRSIDVVPTRPTELAQQLVAELSSTSDDAVIGYRGWERWAQAFEAAPVADSAPVFNAGLRNQGVYLITGGLGGIGLTLAAYLAEEVQARLVLTTRSS